MPDAGVLKCPRCGAAFAPGRPMAHHLREAHQLTGMPAHLIANPNDKQAADTRTGRLALYRANLAADDRFQVIEE